MSAPPIDAIRAHQKVQASRGESYLKEVTLVHRTDHDGFTLEVGGRIDGVFPDESPVVIEEIKTTTEELDVKAAKDNPLHWGQLRVYGYIYALQNDLDAVDLLLTYYQLESGLMREINRRETREELAAFFDELVHRYLDWARRIDELRQTRDHSIEAMSFPHPSYRRGQRDMAVGVYQTIKQGGQLLARAPTGIGKTMAVLFPAIKTIGEGTAEKLFYLTARTTGRALAEQALDGMTDGGLKLKSITLTAKEKICFNPDKACNGEECEFARGFYDRLETALDELFKMNAFTRAEVERVARKHRLCPFELGLELSIWADCIICDYNYVFDPRSYLRRFFDDGGDDYVFLVDEAHNLLDRARDMYSAQVDKFAFAELKRAADKMGSAGLRSSLRAIDKELLTLRRLTETAGGERSETESPNALLAALERFMREAQSLLSESTGLQRGDDPSQKALLDRFFDAVRFLKFGEAFDESYVTCYVSRRRNLRVKLFCMDPSERLAETFAKSHSAVMFSATLAPQGYFLETLGCSDRCRTLTLPSPFPPANLCVLVGDRVATTYKRRSETKGILTDLLRSFVAQKHGNYLIYFPSYAYLDAVRALFSETEAGAEVLVQTPDMSEQERHAFIARFCTENDSTLVGFAVMGGVFGEGIDLLGERLCGAAIVGVGLPALSPERDRIRDHFDRRGGHGFEYAYMYPGMNRVLQAAGRVIRSETDRGALLLIDERFAQSRYRRLFPGDWSPRPVRNGTDIAATLQPFWTQ